MFAPSLDVRWSSTGHTRPARLADAKARPELWQQVGTRRADAGAHKINARRPPCPRRGGGAQRALIMVLLRAHPPQLVVLLVLAVPVVTGAAATVVAVLLFGNTAALVPPDAVPTWQVIVGFVLSALALFVMLAAVVSQSGRTAGLVPG